MHANVGDGSGLPDCVCVCGSSARAFGRRREGYRSRFTCNRQMVVCPIVGLVLWLFYLVPGSNGRMVFFWVGILCTYLLALISLPRIRSTLGPGVWLILRTVAIEYIALVFAADFILIPLQVNGFGKYPLTYLPFAILLIGGAGLRVAAYIRQQLPLARSIK